MTRTHIVEGTDADVREDPAVFANNCIDLLCKQEKALWLLGEQKEKAESDQSLELTWQMLVEFLDFAETHFDKEEFGEIAGPLHRVHQHTTEHKHKIRTRSWRWVLQLVGYEIPSETEVTESYQELGNDYAELFQTFFEVCSRRLADGSDERERFHQSIGIFLTELKEKW